MKYHISHLVAQDLHQLGKMMMMTTSLLPRPRSESCFSTMETEAAASDHLAQERSYKRSPKRDLAMTMLNLPLNPLKKKLHIGKSIQGSLLQKRSSLLGIELFR